MSARQPLPKWADRVLLPIFNVMLAFTISGLAVMMVGENPFKAIGVIFYGAFGYGDGIGFTLYYATNFIFTGLAFALVFHGRMFNIGADGQAYVAGLGVILVALALDHTHWLIAMPAAMLAGAAFGGTWAFIPGWLQAKRGSHVVITTIMFNFIASALMVYMITRVLKPDYIQPPESAPIEPAGRVPQLREFIDFFGYSPVNMTLFVAIFALIAVYVLIWRTKFGYDLRVMGANREAATYAGISNSRTIVLVMTISGVLASMVAINEVMGVQNRLTIDFVGGAGFVGIAVALMGRSHPVGILFAAILFGALYQGGQELQFVMPALTKELIIVIQALVVLFTGAMEELLRAPLERIFAVFRPAQPKQAAVLGK